MSLGARTPWMGCFVLNDQNVHSLLSLMQSLPASQQPFETTRTTGIRCQYLVLGNDINNGGAKLYVGNETVTTSFFGYRLVASSFVPLYSMEANLIRLDHIYVLGDTNGLVVNVIMLTR